MEIISNRILFINQLLIDLIYNLYSTKQTITILIKAILLDSNFKNLINKQ